MVSKLVKKIYSASGYSFEGLIAAFKSEYAFRLEVVIGGLIILVSFFISVSLVWHFLLISCVLLVFIAELINTAIEAVVDGLDLPKSNYFKVAKDCGSAAVMVCVVNALICWFLVIFFI